MNDGDFGLTLHSARKTQITCLRSKPKLKPRQRLPKPCICASPGLAPCPVSLGRLPALMCICVCILADHSTVQSPRSLLLLFKLCLNDPRRPNQWHHTCVAVWLCPAIEFEPGYNWGVRKFNPAALRNRGIAIMR